MLNGRKGQFFFKFPLIYFVNDEIQLNKYQILFLKEKKICHFYSFFYIHPNKEYIST